LPESGVHPHPRFKSGVPGVPWIYSRLFSRWRCPATVGPSERYFSVVTHPAAPARPAGSGLPLSDSEAKSAGPGAAK
jgi:hypothetical protein